MAERSAQTGDTTVRRLAKPRLPLTVDEIIELDSALVEAFRTIQALRSRFKAARHIKFPPLPSLFSESMVIASVHRLFGPTWEARYGGVECDVLIENLAGETRRLEVKATGEHAFQEFKAKDLRADVLVWIRFGRRFQEGTGPIEIALLSQPSRLIPKACRLDKVRFERRVGSGDHLRLLSFESLHTLLGLVPPASPQVAPSPA